MRPHPTHTTSQFRAGAVRQRSAVAAAVREGPAGAAPAGRALNPRTARGWPPGGRRGRGFPVGFREEEEARLFEAFYTTKPGGLGMGLSISRSILDRRGDRLWATANWDHGPTFYFVLPGMR